MALGEVTDSKAVIAAIAEFDDVGRDAFLKKYGSSKIHRVVAKSLYMDDILPSVDDIEEAVLLRRELQEICAAAGLPIRKWMSNEEDALREVPDALRAHAQERPLKDEELTTKVLGMHWNITKDTYGFKKVVVKTAKPTKRSILSDLASIYDPLGLAGPVVLHGWVLLQKLHALRPSLDIQWDTD
ncbi:MAG TPA: hypothetical protein EYQ64_02290, partial [Gemmatimonadetes bacterium]|nr:hypothetical protein [Gemmatimonadota bacterium]